MDGTYTVATHGRPSLTKACTVTTPYTIRNQNQRVALLSGDGASYTLRILDSAFITLDGLRIKSVTNTTCNNSPAVYVQQSNHVTVKNALIYENSNYCNTGLLSFHNNLGNLGSNGNQRGDHLTEDTELYSFHRHASTSYYSTFNTWRRVYCHSRNRPDIIGGYASASPTRGEGCVAIYPGSDSILENVIAENVLEIVEINAAYGVSMGRRNQVLGSILTGNATYPSSRAIILDSRGNTTAYQVQDTTIRDVVHVYIGSAYTSWAIASRSALNTQMFNVTVIDHGYSAIGAFDQGTTGGGIVSFFCTNCLALNNNGIGISVATSTVDTWTVTNSNAFGNVTNYSPSSHANYEPSDTPSAVDPQMGTCYLWQPDGSAAKTNNWGANILYRYVDGVLTTTPLWDPTTGEFPHGAIIAGVNDIAGQSLFDVHTRLNVNTGGCSFPASYVGGGTPANPATMVTSQGTTSTSHPHTLPAGLDFLLQCIVLYDQGGNVGNVNTAVSGVESLTLIATAVSSPAYRRAALYRRTAPTTGEQTQVVTTTGAVTGMRTTSIEAEGYASIGANATATNLSSTPSVTVVTSTTDTIYDCLAGKKTITLSADANQTLQRDDAVTTTDIRSAISTQSGANGGLMSYTMGSNNYWATVAVSMGGGAGGTSTLRLSKYRLCAVYGPEVCASWNAAQDTAMNIAPTGGTRIRMEVIAETATSSPTGVSLQCRKNAEAYAPASDSFGSKVYKLYGPGVESNLPSSLTSTTQQISAPGSFTAGALIRDAASVFIIPAMIANNKTEIEYVVNLNAAVGDTVDCKVVRDSGTDITTYTVTPRLTVIAPSASGVAQADQPTGLSVHPDPSMPRWPLVGSLGDASKNF
jgi:hypothetical protein